jgi:uncharacterized repeat protein (TIGR01451 family)
LNDIQSGDSVEVTILVTPMMVEDIENLASVSSNLIDLNTSNNTASETTTVKHAADLAVSKVGEPDVLYVGQTLTYTLTVTNHGPSIASNVMLTDTLPAGVSFGSKTLSQGSCVEGDEIICELGDILVGNSVTITLVTTPTIDGDLSNIVSISSSTTDLNPGNDMDSEGTRVNPIADLSVSQSDHPDPVTAQEILEYVVSIDNHGPSDAENVTLDDTLDPGVTYVSVSPSATDCSLASHILHCALGTIPADQSLVITITTRTNQTTTGIITNQISITSDTFDPVSGNNTSVVTTTLPPDNIPPTVNWIAPTTYKGRYYVGGEIIRLEVNATDDVAVDYVKFYWWDYKAIKWRVIGVDHTAPYQWQFNTFVLNPKDNQVVVVAYDTAGNRTPAPGAPSMYIWLYYTPPPYVIYVPLVLR